MCRICSENNPTDSEARRTSLLHFVRTDVGDAIIAGFGVTGKNLLVPQGLSFDVLLAAKPRDISIGNPVETVFCKSSCHIEILGMNNEVGIPVTIFVEVVVHLGLV